MGNKIGFPQNQNVCRKIKRKKSKSQNQTKKSKADIMECKPKKLNEIDNILSHQGLTIKVFQGYRSLKEQEKRFDEVCHSFRGKNLNKEEIYKKHIIIAVPKFAGHPTDGAVNVVIIEKSTG